MDINDVMKTFVDQYAPMNPETEFLVPSTDLLQNGMEILIADPDRRESRVEIESGRGRSIHQALEKNRWCTVSHLSSNSIDHGYKNYSFMASYSDGMRVMRTYHVSDSWLVKFSSVDVLQQTRDAVMELVAKAMIKQDRATFRGESCNSEIAQVGIDVTDEILKIFGMGAQK